MDIREWVWAIGVAVVGCTPMVIAASCSWVESGRWEQACVAAGGVPVNRSNRASRACIRAEQVIELDREPRR
jgi:hypothetical protein